MSPRDFRLAALPLLDDVTRFARWLCRRGEDAEDLVQECYTRAFGACGQLRDGKGVRVWLFRIAHHAWIDRGRGDATRSRFLVYEGGLDELASHALGHLEEDAVRALDARRVRAALDALPDEMRECVVLVEIWGFTYREVADTVGVPIGTVRSRVARGRARLEAELQRLLPEGAGRRGGAS